MDDEQMLELEILESDVHGWSDLRSRGPFDLETDPAATSHDEEVKFRSTMGCPEVAFV